MLRLIYIYVTVLDFCIVSIRPIWQPSIILWGLEVRLGKVEETICILLIQQGIWKM